MWEPWQWVAVISSSAMVLACLATLLLPDERKARADAARLSALVALVVRESRAHPGATVEVTIDPDRRRATVRTSDGSARTLVLADDGHGTWPRSGVRS